MNDQNHFYEISISFYQIQMIQIKLESFSSNNVFLVLFMEALWQYVQRLPHFKSFFPILSTPFLVSGKLTSVFTFTSLSPAGTDTSTETLHWKPFPVNAPSVHWIGAVGVRKWSFT